MQSAVRIPTPEPVDTTLPIKRKRSPESRSPSPRRHPRRESPPPHFRDDDPPSPQRPRSPVRRRSPSPPAHSREEARSPPREARNPAASFPRDVDRARAVERLRQLEMRQKDVVEDKPLTAEEKQAAAKAEYDRLLNMRSGGTYIPPARLRALQAQITDKTSKEYQRMAWEALKKSINGLINKVNVSNIKHIVPELFGENLVRGRGLFCRSIMKAQAASLPFTPIYAAMTAIVNTKLPQVGELLAKRLVVQFRKAFKRNDKAVCLSSTTFLAHLCNQQVVHEMLVAQILLLLLHKPTDDSVEIAVGLTREVGQHLEEMSGPIALAVFDQFRSILHEADIDKRVQYMIEVLFQVRKDKYKDNSAIKEELDLVEEEDQITHRVGLEDEVEVQDGLNVFKFDEEWEANETAYSKLKAEILGDGSDDESGEDDSDESSEEGEEDVQQRELEIKDQTNTDLVNLRRTIYLTIKSSGGFQEAVHKLLKLNIPAGSEPELPSMIVECASQERTYEKFYGLIGERLCKINRQWTDLFELSFATYYETIHRFETNRLRIIASFFGHLLASDAIGWHVLSIIRLTESETTSASRIFIKILFEELTGALGLKTLTARARDPLLADAFSGIFPKDEARNVRFSINFFTHIGMGVLTEDMREWLQNMPKPALPAPVQEDSESESDSDSASSYSSRSGSRSRSRSVSRSRSRTRRRDRSRSRSESYTPSRSRSPRRSNKKSKRSLSRSVSESRSRSRSRSRSVPRKRVRESRSASVSSRSRTPPRRRNRSASYSRSRSDSRSRSRSRSRSVSRRSRSRSDSRSRSPPTKRVREASYSRSRSRSRSYSRSRSPSHPPPRKNGKDAPVSRTPSKTPPRQRSPSPRPRREEGERSGFSERGRGRGRGGRARGVAPRGRDSRRDGGRDSGRQRRNTSSDSARSRSRSRGRGVVQQPPKVERERSESPWTKRARLGRGVN